VYSVSLGTFASATGFFYLWAFLHAPVPVWVTIVMYGFAVNAGGFWLGRTLETLARRDFAQKAAIAKEKDRSERLLANALPAAIAHRLRDADLRLGAERAALAERHEAVTVLVADLVGFTPLAEKLAPEELAALLDRLFSTFDELCTRRGVEKIKTLGDAWIAAAGAPDACADHTERTARLALDMLRAVESLQADAPHSFAVRIGVASGSAIAGVIGRTRFAYDLWGDAVDEAKAMEHGGAAGKVRVSERAAKALGGRFRIEEEGAGMGKVRWLVGEVD
jgi:class 3 adenylate cyclase